MPYRPKQIKKLLSWGDDVLIPADDMPSRAGRVVESANKKKLYSWETKAVNAVALRVKAFQTDLIRYISQRAERRDLTKLSMTKDSAALRDEVDAYVQLRLPALIDGCAADGLRYATGARIAGYYGRLWLLDELTPEHVRVNTPEPQQAALATAQVFREDVYDEIIKSLLGKDWRSQYADQLGDLTLRIKQAISTGMSEGEGIAEIQRRVRDTIGVDTNRARGAVGSAQNKGYRANFNRVQAITRTVVNQASNDGAIEAYKANDDIIKGFQILTANDERVCPQCFALNGRVYGLNSFERPPFHVNCRCGAVPVLYSDTIYTTADAPKNTYSEWLDKVGARQYLTDFLAA